MTKDDFRDDLDQEDEEFEVLTLIDDDGEEHSFELLVEIEMEGNFYVVVAPMDDEESEDEEEVEVIIFRATYDDEGNMYLEDIEDDEEWEKVADTWQELMDSEELE